MIESPDRDWDAFTFMIFLIIIVGLFLTFTLTIIHETRLGKLEQKIQALEEHSK